MLVDRGRGACYARMIAEGDPVGEASMNFQDRRLWYIVLAVIVVLIIVYGLWPAGEVAPPPATQ
jgi:hypothetical protein